jgi:hypothetical protein
MEGHSMPDRIGDSPAGVVKSDAVLDTIRMYTKVLISPQVGTNAGACEAPSE